MNSGRRAVHVLTGMLAVAWVRSAGAQTALALKPDASSDMLALTAKALIVALVCLVALAAGLYVWRQRQQIARPGTASGSIPVPRVEWARRISPR